MIPNFTLNRFLIFFLFFFHVVVFAATKTYTGANNGNWSTASNWSPSGVPNGTDDVIIPSGKIVVLDVLSVAANSITVSGVIEIPADSNISINSLLIVVSSPSGSIFFNKKSIITLPQNVALYLQNGSKSLDTSDNGVCSNNTEIHVGTTNYAVCTGGGALYSFDQVESAGGINVVTAGVIGVAQNICGGTAPNTLTSATAATGSGTITYQWQATDSTGSYVTITSAISENYLPPVLNATTSYRRRTVSVINGQTFYSQYTSSVTITITSTTAAPTGTASQSFCASNNPTVANLTATGTGIKWYAASSGGAALATNTVLTNGTHYYASQTLNGCESASRLDVTVTVNALPTLSGASQASPVCAGSGATVNLTGMLPNSTSTISYTINGSTQAPITGVVANASGIASFTSAILTIVNNNQYLQITGVTTTGVTPSCTSNIYVGFNLQVTSSSTPTNIRGDNESCNGYIARWDGSATNFYIDVATTSTFDSGTIVPSYDNANLGNVGSVNLTGLLPNTTYYFRVRASGSCGFSGYSSVGSFTTLSIATPTNVRSDNVNWCTSTIRWDGSATKFFIDVATSNTFSAGTMLSAYNNLDVGNVNSLILSGLLPNTMYYFRVRRMETCGLSGNSAVSNFTTMAISSPTANAGYASCNDWVAQWNGVYDTSGNEADGYYLDVAIDNGFTNYVSGYQDLYVGKTNAYTITGLARGGVYYFRIRANTSCGVGSNSNVVTFTEIGNWSSNPGTITGGANSICVGSTATFIKDENTWPSTGTWSVFNQTGSASITQSGVVTGVSVGTVKVVFTTYNGGCGTSTSRDLTVTPGSVVGTASSSPNLCIGETMIDVTHTTTGATGIGMATDLPAGVYASWSSNTITISGTPTASGTFNYSIPLTGGCSGINATGTIIVTSLPTPTAETPTNPSCKVPTGSVILNNLPSSGTIVQTGERNDSIEILGGGSQTITGLHPGTYYFAVTNGSCTSATVTVVILEPETNTWSSSGWSDGTPTINQRLVFGTDYTNANDVDLLGCSCQVTGSAVVTIKSGRTLKIENGVEVQPNATLIFENNASLVQINDAAVNSGNINYKRHTAPVKRYDFTYWASPVAGQTMKALSPGTLGDKYYSYNPTSGWKIEYNGALTMEAGKGYIIRAPQTFSITVPAIDTNPVFVGVPNNGLVSFSIAANQTHLLGNPYPSAIDADKFIAANSTSLEGTLYFWTHNTSPSKDIAGDAIYNYTTNDYITYNKTGGVNVATGKIAAGQGFFAPASAAGGTIVFNNAMRYTEGQPNYDNSNFLKINSTSKTVTTTTATEKNRVWLNLTNSEGAFKQTLLGYITGATNGYDAGYDGMSYDGNQFVDFYSVNNAVNLSIQGRALPFVKQDSVVLGYKSTIKGEFKISIDRTDGALATQNIFLEDKDLKVLHDLKQGAYTFNTEKGIFNNRFVLRYVDKNAVEPVVETPVVETPVIDSSVTVSVKQDQITVSSSEDLISKIIIYDIAGKIIYQKEDVSANDFMIQNLLSSKQVLLVTLVLENGKTTSTKIVY
ncbi:Purple acid Phosphatase, N-terminal domain [Flavobacterium flevense]|uniref:fibronectin type III domain-containing protein n=1 Tax=Flavobacterium flevense TaxID=983 RepID=UPI0009180CC5|nr:fibronectin type III domain-containing protein [Flavobacterium flevense]SHL55776.1 Purple acid Phosphatase, N-terminal domain [Flavobacterium flevense]